MKIVHKLQLLMLLPIVLAVVVSLLLVGARYRLNEAQTRDDLARTVVRRVFQLDWFTYEYVLHGSARTRAQWVTAYDRLDETLSHPESRKSADRRIVAEAADELALIHRIFTGIVESRRETGSPASAGPATEKEIQQFDQLLLASYHLMQRGAELEDSSLEAAEIAIRSTALLVLLVVMATAALLALLSSLIGRSISRPLQHLHRGTEIVGTGNLDHKVGLDQQDELGQLSRAFDGMTAGLKQVTVSRDELAREVAERVRAEEDLRETTRELAARNAQMEKDLDFAREIQLAFLPQQPSGFPPDTRDQKGTVQFTHRYEPAEQLGGDFFDLLHLPSGDVGVLICDVMGHGVRAALVTAMLRGLIEEMHGVAEDPGRFLTELNREFIAAVNRSDILMFTTAFYIVADGGRRGIRYACAGHPSPFWIRNGPRRVVPLPTEECSTGPAIGFFENPSYSTCRQTVAEGDTILLCTDGILEVESDDGKRFGRDQLTRILSRQGDLPQGALLDVVIAEARTCAPRNRFEDDVCLVGVRFGASSDD
jgi:serine phosphatase RsbU (regulator of sigma subunit)